MDALSLCELVGQCCIMQALLVLAHLSILALLTHLVGAKTRVEVTSEPLSAVLPKIQELEGSSQWGSKRALNI